MITCKNIQLRYDKSHQFANILGSIDPYHWFGETRHIGLVSEENSVSGIDGVRRPADDERHEDDKQCERDSPLLNEYHVFVCRRRQNHSQRVSLAGDKQA